jgi:hypothetical protein
MACAAIELDSRRFVAQEPKSRPAAVAPASVGGGIVKFLFVGLFIFLLIAWLCGFVLFHVASGMIHLLLLFAFISLIIHFVAGRSAA